MNKAFFFDRDGIVNKRIIDGYVTNTDEFEIIDEILTIFEMIKSSGHLAILITNQQGIGKGLMSEEDLSNVHDFMQEILEINTGYKFDDIYYCPDLADSGSICRKPHPGMIINAAEKWNIDLNNSWMIGDSTKDAIAGKNSGCRSILIGNYSQYDCPEADFIFKSHGELRFYLNNFILDHS